MPYIPQDARKIFDKHIREIARNLQTPGELNYVISKIINLLLVHKGVNYNQLNEIVGAMECAKLELYRRIAVPYEDEKIKSNGDI